MQIIEHSVEVVISGDLRLNFSGVTAIVFAIVTAM